MIVDKSGKIFDERRKTERRTKLKESQKVDTDKRQGERRKNKQK